MIIFRQSLKTKIIISFCLVMLSLLVFMAVSSYRFIRSLYLTQLSDQVRSTAAIVGRNINPKFVHALDFGKPTLLTRSYFDEFFATFGYKSTETNYFIFNGDFRVCIHSGTEYESGSYQPRLMLNRKEIFDLKNGQSVASFPFKGGDGIWYLWSFYRLDTNYWLGIQESALRLQRVETFARLFWIIGIVGIIITILLGWWLATMLIKPISKLAAVSTEIGKGNLQIEMPEKLPEELNILTHSMEKMRDDLKFHQREKEEILAQIAHEIRNPLGGIELLVNLTKEDIQSGKQECRYLDRIITEIAGLKQLITAYLGYSRPAPANIEKTDLAETISAVEDLMTDKLNNRLMSIQLKGNLTALHFDRKHLKQIFLNLITNSLESMKNGLSVQIQGKESTDNWEIIYSDNGPGIPPDKQEEIFKPFFTTKKDGTGLGLSVCKKLCRENGADITVDKGSRFIIRKTKRV